MPLPRWLARFNKHTFNRAVLKKGKSPVLIHVGRSSGRVYHVPLDAHPVDGGYLFIANYGERTDWLRNVLVAGTAVLLIDSTEVELDSPTLVSIDEAWAMLPSDTKKPASWLNITDFLRMRTLH